MWTHDMSEENDLEAETRLRQLQPPLKVHDPTVS